MGVTVATALTKRQQQQQQQQQRTPSSSAPQAGDLIFVRPAPDDRVGQLVADATGGVYSHVRIRIASDMVMEALAHAGVVRSYAQIEPDPADVAPLGATLDVDRLAHALAWLLRQEGHPYDWLAIAGDALQAVLPPALGSRTPFLVAPSCFDCSALGARFLIRAGYRWLPDALIDAPEQATPNGLARAVGVLK